MRNYITLDGKKYKTQSTNWVEVEVNARQTTRLASGRGDVTFGASGYCMWTGTLIAPVVAEEGWGTKDTLAEAFRKKAKLAYEDHLGNTYEVAVGSRMEKRSQLPDWDNVENVFNVFMEIVSL